MPREKRTHTLTQLATVIAFSFNKYGMSGKTARLSHSLYLVGLALGIGLGAYLLLRDGSTGHGKAPRDRVEWFKDAKFGLMITWGPVSLVGTEISWSRAGHRRGEDNSEETRGTIPVEEYDQLYLRFNPTQFDAARYVQLAQAAGAKYVIFPAKHHDGFCMFDSVLTDYKITNAPIRRDLTAEFVQACHQAGMPLGIYYSPVDWYHPDYRTPRHDRYIQYLHGQVRELCTRYGKIDIFWFDGLYWRVQDWDAERLFSIIRELQPGALINDRAALPGDFATLDTENRIGEYNDQSPWETCMPLGDQWAYKPNDALKPAAECIHNLVRCAGAGGNFLLGIAPDSTGLLDPRAIECLEEIGRWLAANGRSIYQTRPGPLLPDDWGVCTHRDRSIFLHVLNPDAPLSVPALPHKIVSAATLTGHPVQCTQSSDATQIILPEAARDPIDTIVELRW